MKKIKLYITVVFTLLAAGLSSVPVYAQQTNGGGTCGGTKTQLVTCSGSQGIGAIGDLIKITITIMTVLIGVVSVGALAYAGILYATAQDDQGKVSSARTVIRNVVIGIVLYGFTIAIINWLIPGGVIG
jgi:heme/copper-type cytochrome/quinol oxidase subunit 2